MGAWSWLFGGNKPQPYSKLAAKFTRAIISREAAPPPEALGINSDRIRAMWLEHRKPVIGLPLDNVLREHHGRFLSEVHAHILDKRESHGHQHLLPVERRIDAVESFRMEVNNGGIHQYFLNSAGNDAQIALEFMKEIGANEATAILSEAVRRLPGSRVPSDRRKRLMLLEELPLSTFQDLDNTFYHTSEESLKGCLTVWVSEHLSELDLPPA